MRKGCFSKILAKQKFALIGENISKSLSPELFYKAYNRQDDYPGYEYDKIERSTFAEAFQIFLNEYEAVNITSPYKEEAFRVAAKKDPLCDKIQAANILKKNTSGELTAYNSDFAGVVMSIAEVLSPEILVHYYTKFGINCWKPICDFVKSNLQKRYQNEVSTIVIGCGGAGKAAIIAAQEMGFKTIIMNRSRERAEKFVSSIQPYYSLTPKIEVASLDELRQNFERCKVLIYTASEKIPNLEDLIQVGRGSQNRHDMIGNDLGDKIILEANYNKISFNKMLLKALSDTYPKLRYVSGSKWLLYQALIGFEIMTGNSAKNLIGEKYLPTNND